MGLKILMVSPQFRPIVGGYERAAERLSIALVARGHAVTVIAERRDPSWPASEMVDGVEVRRLWCLFRRRWHTVTSLSSHMLFLLRHGREYHVWHVHQYGEVAVLAAVLGKLLHRPVLLKLTSTGPQGVFVQVSHTWMSRLKRRALCGVDAVMATTREVAAEAVAFGIPESAVRCVGNGVDTDRFRPRGREEEEAMRQNLGIEADGVVVYVGRLSEEKNPLGLLAAWKMAYPRIPGSWKLLVVGDGPLSEEVKQRIEVDGLTARTSLVGFQPNVEQWISTGDIFVMSSINEGLSNSMLEAMASGVSVVTTRVSGSAQLCEETGAGVVVDAGRMDLLADALVRVASDAELRTRMGEAGRNAVSRHYSISHVAMQHEEVYRGLLLDHRDSWRTG